MSSIQDQSIKIIQASKQKPKLQLNNSENNLLLRNVRHELFGN